MNAELKAKWIEALRSGKYKQGAEGLQSSNGTFCCLGVLCDQFDPTGWNPSREFVFAADSRMMFLPDSLADHIGIEFVIQEHLAHRNDAGEPFVAIADWIEQNIPADAS